MAALPIDLSEQLRTVEIDTVATARLATVYHRNVARRLVEALQARAPSGLRDGSASPSERDVLLNLARRVRRLPPSWVYTACTGAPSGIRSDAGLAEVLRASAEPPAATEVYCGPNDAWVRAGLDQAVAALDWDEPDTARLVRQVPGDVDRALTFARHALATCWPAAWSEHNTLIAYLVFAEGPLRSATTPSTFGAIYVSVEEAADPLRMFQVLLHETGHHALSLRDRFTAFLDNPDDIAHHPLRPDPRPLRGVFHAAFVLARMSEGLARYLAAFPGGGPLDGLPVADELARTTDSLSAVLDTLQESARWTDAGAALARDLRAASESLPGRPV